MEPDKFILGLLAFLTVLIGGVMLVGDFNNNYRYDDLSMNNDDFDYLDNATQQLYSDSQTIKDGVVGAEIDQENSLDSMLIGAYQSMRIVINSLSIVTKIINSISTKIGIPTPFVVIGMVAIMIALIFAIIYILFRR